MEEINRPLRSKKNFFFYSVMFLMPVAVFALCSLSFIAYKTVRLFHVHQGWKGNIHAAHPQLGDAPVPNARGSQVFQSGPDIPTWSDEDGFRVPVDAPASSHPRPLILALGCSVTYGYSTRAEDAYPFLVGRSLNGTSKNAGVSGYGLCQMFLLAQKLLPALKPDYLLVQYSPWLVDRAQTPFQELHIGRIPTPYFYEKDSHFAIHPPVYSAKVFDFPFDRYVNAQGKWSDGWSFYWKVSVPLSVIDGFNRLKYSLYRGIGAIPKPTGSREGLITYVYNEINAIARENGAQTVIVVLGDDATPVKLNEQWFPSDALVVNAHDSLLKRLPLINAENYLKEYAHWRGSPPVVVDAHPNERAHRVITDAIVSAIRKSERTTKESKQ
jgi:hypothetical protein